MGMTATTERLSLSPHVMGDLDDSAAMWGDPAVVRYIGGKTFTREQCWARLLRYAGHWTWLGFGYWVVRLHGSGRFVGEVGFADFRRTITPSLEGTMELGWVLAPWAHGQGFATEAARAALAWKDAHRPAPRATCIIDPENAASLRVAAKCGFREIARTTYEGGPTVMLER